jgi:hypothetical protein
MTTLPKTIMETKLQNTMNTPMMNLPSSKKRKRGNSLHPPNVGKINLPNTLDNTNADPKFSHNTTQSINYINKKPVCPSSILPAIPSQPYNVPPKTRKPRPPPFSKKFKIGSSAHRTHNISNQLIKSNKLNPDSTFTEKRILLVRDRFLKAHDISRTPHPITTHQVIYAGYDRSRQRSPIYIGKTSHSTLTRYLSEISPNYYRQSNNLSKFIRKIKPHNYNIIPLQSVPNWDMSQAYEHYWINVFQTQLPNSQYLTLHDTYKTHKLNTCSKHQSINLKKHNSSLIPATNSRSDSLNTDITSDLTPVYHTLNNKRIFFSRQWSKRILTLYHKLSSNNFDQSSFKYIDSKTLFKFISTITNRNINSLNTLKLHHILNNRQFNSFIRPSPSISLHHHILKNKLTKAQLSKLTHLILFELNSRHIKKPPKNFKIPSSTLIPVSLTTSLLNSLDYNTILQQANHLLPFPYNQVIHLSFKSKPSHPISFLFDNAQQSASLISQTYLNNLPSCSCHLPQFSIYLNSYNHIDTNLFDFLLLLPECKKFYQETKYIISLLSLGPNHRISHFPPKNTIKRIINDTIDTYINKACDLNLLDDSLFVDWKNFILEKSSSNLDLLPLYSNLHPNNQTISLLISKIKDLFTITTTDKLKNNFRITCKPHYNLSIHKMITAHDINLIQPVLPIPYLPSTKSCYTIIPKTLDEIIQLHSTFLNTHSFSINPKLPRKIIQMKPHKPGFRPLVPASNITTTNMSKLLHLALKECLSQLHILNQKWIIKHKTNWFFHIDSSSDLSNLLSSLNKDPEHTPKSSQCGDISGFYDNINHDDTILLLQHNLTKIFQLNKPYLIIKKKTKTTSWSDHNNHDSKYNYVFSLTSLLDCLIWRIRNQVILHGDLILSQNVGIAQGDNHSPFLSIFILTIYEKEFISYHTKHNPRIAFTFSNTVRKIDDILSINNPLFTQYIYKDDNNPHGLYPRKFFTITIEPPNITHFLDVTINIIGTPSRFFDQAVHQRIENLHSLDLESLCQLAITLHLPTSQNCNVLIDRISKYYLNPPNKNIINKTLSWNTVTYNKMDQFNFSFTNNLPHMTSNLSSSIKYGSFTGRLHSFATTNLLKFEDFIYSAANLILKLTIKNLYKYSTLESKLITFIHKHLKHKYNVSSTHIIQYYIQNYSHFIKSHFQK